MRTDARGWPMWSGVEIEGRLAGLRTLFVSERATPALVLERLWQQPAHQHLYVNPDAGAAHGWDVWLDIARKTGALLTLCVTPEQLAQLTPVQRREAHLMLALPVPNVLALLKDSDTVRLDPAPYTTYSAVVGQFRCTHPAMYNADANAERTT